MPKKTRGRGYKKQREEISQREKMRLADQNAHESSNKAQQVRANR